MKISSRDKEILRKLAQETAEIAALPIQQETKRLWRALNSLKPERPMLHISQIPWHEMDVEDELLLKCEDQFCRTMEQKLRRDLYKWKHIRDDMVVEPFFDVSKAVLGANFGIRHKENTAINDPKNSVVGHQYIGQIKNEEDLLKIKIPEIKHDEALTNLRVEIANEAFGGILEVRTMGLVPSFGAWDHLAKWYGIEGLLYDLVDKPEFIHKMIDRFTTASLAMLDQLEEQGLLAYDQAIIHCSGAYTDELPAPGFNKEKPRAKDMWTYGMAQIFSTVSPAMHDEFEIDYSIKWCERFGNVYYGCCEPLHKKIDIIRRIPNVRKISMSPWVKIEEGAEAIGRDYVFSRKPNPAFLAGGSLDRELVRKDLEETLECCSSFGCPLEFILKDISTVAYKPERLWEWADIAAGVVGR